MSGKKPTDVARTTKKKEVTRREEANAPPAAVLAMQQMLIKSGRAISEMDDCQTKMYEVMA